MEMKPNKEKISELFELLEIPEIRQIIMAKLEQAKLIFFKEIREFYKRKYPNLIEFPGSERGITAANEEENNSTGQKKSNNRIELQCLRGFFDTTRYVALSEADQISLFQEYFEKNKGFRSEILYEFFLKKMPYADIYENIG